MTVKTLCSAILGLFLSGQMAEASTFHVEDYHLKLRFEGTSFNELLVTPHSDPMAYFTIDVAPGEYEYGISEYTHLTIGEIVDFIVTISFPVPEPIVIGGYPNGGTTPNCVLGGRDCSYINYTSQKDDGFFLAEYDQEMIDLTLGVGERFVHYIDGYLDPDAHITNDFGTFSYRSQNAHFTIVDIIDAPAPIPLPAGILLLPAAIAGLGVLRRRKAVSPR